jgi:IMP dehydrogenase
LGEHVSALEKHETTPASFISRSVRLKAGGIMSAAMDTVTEEGMAVEMAKNGGIGVIHHNMSPRHQAEMVEYVKTAVHRGVMHEDPVTFSPDVHLSEAQATERRLDYSTFPIVEDDTLVGMVTKDLHDFAEGRNPPLREIMRPRDQLVVGRATTSPEDAYRIMQETYVKKLPVVDDNDTLLGMYFFTDLSKDKKKEDRFSLDGDGHFRVAAAVSFSKDDYDRAMQLAEAGVDAVVLDSAHGASAAGVRQLERLQRDVGDAVDVIIGNVSRYDTAREVLSYDPDSIKVGIGPGSICTTRQQTGHGVPQLTAVYEAARAVRDHAADGGRPVPVIADGGLREPGDAVKAYAFGASGIMLGSVFASTEESAGERITIDDTVYKGYRGMASQAAMAEQRSSRERYDANEDEHVGESVTRAQAEELVPEGIESLVELDGSVSAKMKQWIGGIRSGLAHSGAASIDEFRRVAHPYRVSQAGSAEGAPHSVYTRGSRFS